jgi:hypothetical protein
MNGGPLVGQEERFHAFTRSVAKLISEGRHPQHQLLAAKLTLSFLFPVHHPRP